MKILLAIILVLPMQWAWAQSDTTGKSKTTNQNNTADKSKPINQGSSAEPSIENRSADDISAERAAYLKWHKRFAYLTLGLAAGAIITHEEKKEAKESHKILGMATAAAFFTSTYFAWQAPKDTYKNESRNQKIHRWLGYAAIPLMILLPLSGIDADNDYHDGHSADGIGKMKGALTGLTLATLAATTTVAYFEF